MNTSNKTHFHFLLLQNEDLYCDWNKHAAALSEVTLFFSRQLRWFVSKDCMKNMMRNESGNCCCLIGRTAFVGAASLVVGLWWQCDRSGVNNIN
jgi:hypothetical protein